MMNESQKYEKFLIYEQKWKLSKNLELSIHTEKQNFDNEEKKLNFS
jgi:hypothetical protein